MDQLLDQIFSPILFSGLLAQCMILFACLAGLAKKGWRDKIGLWILVYSICALFFSFVEFYITWELHLENLIVGNLWALTELVILSIFFLTLMPHLKKWILIVLGALLLLAFIEHGIIGSLWEYSGHSRIATCIFLISLSVMGFYLLFVSEETPNLLRTPVFWFLSGTLIYYAGALFSFMLGDRIMSNDIHAIQGLWYIHNVFNTIRYIMYGVGLINIRKENHKVKGVTLSL